MSAKKPQHGMDRTERQDEDLARHDLWIRQGSGKSSTKNRQLEGQKKKPSNSRTAENTQPGMDRTQGKDEDLVRHDLGRKLAMC